MASDEKNAIAKTETRIVMGCLNAAVISFIVLSSGSFDFISIVTKISRKEN
jgi:hypothetical protein